MDDETRQQVEKMDAPELRKLVGTLWSLADNLEQLVKAIPECPVHGRCIPHALEWIEEQKQKEQGTSL